jgi:hypothetical protein
MAGEVVDLAALPRAGRFKRHYAGILQATVARFFGCTVVVSDRPLGALRRRHRLDLATDPRPQVYMLGGGAAAVVARVRGTEGPEGRCALVLSGREFGHLAPVLQALGAALTRALSRGYAARFDLSPDAFGDGLIRNTIAMHYARRRYDYRHVAHLLELFGKLAGATFEGHPFTTGLILTWAAQGYAGAAGLARQAEFFPLRQARRLGPDTELDKRFWYLADGQGAFFLCERALRVAGLAVLAARQRGLHSFVDDYSLGRTLRAGDVAFRVTGPAEFAVTGADGLDFTYKESAWRLRDLPGFAAVVRARLPVADTALAPALLSYALALARRRISALIWVPDDRHALRRFLLPGTRHRLLARIAGNGRRLSLLEPDHAPAVLRLLTSDGVTVIAAGGQILSYGGIVDIGQVDPDGVTGTGEAVAELLGRHGLAVKVSQDGTVAVHHGGVAGPLLL